MKAIPWWFDAVESTRLTLEATCGHRHTSDTFYLKTEKVGSVTEVWTVCRSCKTSESWIYGPLDRKPWRRQSIDSVR